MAGPHGHGHHHHGGGRRFRGGFRGRDVVYIESPDYYSYDCPPGWYVDSFGVCRPIPALQSAAGAGDIALNVNILGPTIAAVKIGWASFDGRQFTQAVKDAYARCAAKAWKNDLASKNDLIALAISSSLDQRAIDDGSPMGAIARDTLGNTWVVLAKRAGWKGQTADDIKKMPGGSQASVELILLVVAVLAMAGVYAWIVYKAAEIIETKIITDAENEELLRLHAEGQKIVDRHLADPNLPWTQEEKDILKRLQDQQMGITQQIGGHLPPPANPFNPAPYLIAAVVALGGYMFFLHKRSP